MNPDPEIREILTLYLLGGGVESYKRDSQVKINKAIEALSQLIEREVLGELDEAIFWIGEKVMTKTWDKASPAQLIDYLEERKKLSGEENDRETRRKSNEEADRGGISGDE